MQVGLADLQAKHPEVNWVFIYISEAHAQDEWPISSARCSPTGQVINIKAHKTLSDRVQAAKNFQELYQLKWQVVVAPMDGSFEQLWRPWPIGIYYLKNQQVKYKAESKASSFDLLGLQQVLGD